MMRWEGELELFISRFMDDTDDHTNLSINIFIIVQMDEICSFLLIRTVSVNLLE